MQRKKRSSYEEHMEDAQALDAEEGRGRLRKGTGSRQQTEIRTYPNEETQLR